MKPTIFVDMDGVLVDFDVHYSELFGKHESLDMNHPSRVDDDLLWKNILSTPANEGFFMTAPWMEGADSFFHELLTYTQPVILTACCKWAYERTALEKKYWITENIEKRFNTKVEVLPVLGGKHKYLFKRSKHDLMIDDMFHVISKWGQENSFMLNINRTKFDVEQAETAMHFGYKVGDHEAAIAHIKGHLNRVNA